MGRFIVWETVTETVTYKHVVDADDEDEARRVVEEERTPDQGTWTDTITEERNVTLVEVVA